MFAVPVCSSFLLSLGLEHDNLLSQPGTLALAATGARAHFG